MNDKDPPFDDLSEEDKEIWNSYTDDFIPKVGDGREEENFEELLNNPEHIEAENNSSNKLKLDNIIDDNVSVKENKKIQLPQNPQLDRRTEEKLRKGKMSIDARIDLHGMTRGIAHEALEKFIIKSCKDGHRHVLVITGKGKSKSTSDEWLSIGKGILKENVPYWLDGVILKPYILKYMHAQPKDGGSGALYVYLKRQR